MKLSNMLLFFLFIIFMITHVFSQSIKLEKINWNGEQVDAASDFINVQLKDNFNEKSLSDFLSANGLSLDAAPDIQNFARIRIDQKTKSLLSFIGELQKSGLFVFAEPDFIIRASVAPNDTYYSNQYALPKVNAPDAWDITTGKDDIIIGVLDSGIPIINDNLSHPDLQNTTKIIKGVDYVGDGNGVKDERGHGTHVAGIVGAETNNSTGVAGINWNSKMRINQVFDISGNGTHSGFRNALKNAVNNGCKIINFSGGSITGSWYMEDAVQYAQNNNVLVVVAAGNYHAQNNPNKVVEYPAAYSTSYDNVIAVSSTTSSDVIASSSSRGSEVVVSAPGDHIFSTLPNYVFYYDTVYGLNQNYDFLSGTSMAAPLVSGLAGLVLSLNPDLPPGDTRDILENNSEDLGTSGFDTLYGHGRIDAFEALKHTPTWYNVIQNDMYAYNGGSIKHQSTSYTSPYTIPEYFWQETVSANSNISYNGIDYIFSNWNDGNTNLTRELILENSGNYTAVYTGHLFSEGISALSNNSSRKLWVNPYWDPENNQNHRYEDGYKLVYEDNGDIYYTEYRYTDVNPSNPYYYWSDEVLISDGSGNSKYPSIDGTEAEYCIAWQQYVPATGKYKIIYRVFETSEPDNPVVITDQSVSSNSRPVVGASCGTLGMIYGWDYNIVWDNGNGLKYYSIHGYEIKSIPGTNSSSHNPTITRDPYLSSGIIAYAWEQNGEILYQKIDFLGSPVNYPVDNITSSYTQLNNCRTPSIEKNGVGNIMLVWCATESGSDHIYSREFKNSSWQSLSKVTDNFYQAENPVLSYSSDDYSLIWKVKDNDYFATAENINSQGWSVAEDINTYYVSGVKNPTIGAADNASIAVWSEPASSYYKISPNKVSDLSDDIPQNITSNFTLLGNITLENDLTVSSGAILTIYPGTKIKIATGKKIIINGTLNAQGTGIPYRPITFDRSSTTGTWGGIQINSSGSADLSYCNIKNASLGLEADNCGSISIEHSKFIDCSSGLSTSGLSSMGLNASQITGYTYTGSYIDIGAALYAYGSLITLDDEPLSDFSQIALKNYGGDIYFGLGELCENGQALYNEYGSWADLGDEPEDSETGYNNIICNLIDINTFEDMLAINNYWGGDEPENFVGTGEIEYDPWLEEPSDDNPYGGDCSSYNKSSDSNITSADASFNKFTSDDYKLYKLGYSKYKKEDFSGAVSDFESLISNYPESFFARFALQKWLLIKFSQNSKSEILPYLSSLKKSKSLVLKDYVSMMDVLTYRKLNQPNTALSKTKKSINKSKSELYNSFFKYQEGLIYKNDLKNLKQAEISFNEYLQQYPNDGRTQLVHHQLNILSTADQPLVKKAEAQKSSTAESVNFPDKFELSSAYPNPFNPSTTFRYTSPWDGFVKLEIYNSLGQRIRLFKMRHFSKGTNELVWNGQNELGNMVTSGIYLVRFIAESERDKTKRFEGLSKVIFLK